LVVRVRSEPARAITGSHPVRGSRLPTCRRRTDPAPRRSSAPGTIENGRIPELRTVRRKADAPGSGKSLNLKPIFDLARRRNWGIRRASQCERAALGTHTCSEATNDTRGYNVQGKLFIRSFGKCSNFWSNPQRRCTGPHLGRPTPASPRRPGRSGNSERSWSDRPVNCRFFSWKPAETTRKRPPKR